MRPIDNGTIQSRRAFASCICLNSPDQSILYPRGSLTPEVLSSTLLFASLIAPARSRPLTLNLIGMNRRLFSR